MRNAWYRKSLTDLEADAGGGDGHAIALYAQAFARGLRGAAVDRERAATLLERAGGAGSAVAARWLGDLWHRDRDDLERARSWWRRAAELGDADAMTNLLDGSGSEEELRWLVQAAERGQPHARERLRAMREGDERVAPTLAEFARTPLADLAAAGESDGGMDASFTLRGPVDAVNELAGRWVEAVGATWQALVVEAESDGEPVDFPAPQPPDVSWEEGVTMFLRSGCRLLQLDVSYDEDDEEWSLSVSSFEPHPSDAEAKSFLGALRAAAKEAGIRLKAD